MKSTCNMNVKEYSVLLFCFLKKLRPIFQKHDLALFPLCCLWKCVKFKTKHLVHKNRKPNNWWYSKKSILWHTCFIRVKLKAGAFRSNISPRNIYKWPKRTWKDDQHHQSPGNCKSKPPCDITSDSLGCSHFFFKKQKITSVDKDVEKAYILQRTESSDSYLYTHYSRVQCLLKDEW